MGQTVMPGKWLLAFARLVFSPAAISAVIEPTIGDMRIEWSDPDADASAKVACQASRVRRVLDDRRDIADRVSALVRKPSRFKGATE